MGIIPHDPLRVGHFANRSLRDRVQVREENGMSQFCVDEFLLIQVDAIQRNVAMPHWTRMKNVAWRFTALNLVLTGGAALCAFAASRFWVIMAGVICSIVFAILTGTCWGRYAIASQQRNIWENPGSYLISSGVN